VEALTRVFDIVLGDFASHVRLFVFSGWHSRPRDLPRPESLSRETTARR
jgi:hypothetical protein